MESSALAGGGSEAERHSQVMQDRSPCTNLSCLRALQAAAQNEGLGQAGLELDTTWTKRRKNEKGRERMILWGKLCKYVLPFADKGGCEALRRATLFVCSHTLPGPGSSPPLSPAHWHIQLCSHSLIHHTGPGLLLVVILFLAVRTGGLIF